MIACSWRFVNFGVTLQLFSLPPDRLIIKDERRYANSNKVTVKHDEIRESGAVSLIACIQVLAIGRTTVNLTHGELVMLADSTDDLDIRVFGTDLDSIRGSMAKPPRIR